MCIVNAFVIGVHPRIQNGHDLTSGFDGPASGKARPRRTGVAMVCCGNMAVRFRRTRHFRNMNFASTHKESHGKIKVTVIKIPVPGNRDQRTAHNAVHSTGIEV